MGNKYGLVIGCSYPGSRMQLNGTINDAKNMKDFFEKYGYKGYDGGSIVFMNDKLPSSSYLYPKKDNILTQFRTILEKAQSGDDVVIFYAGHGEQLSKNSKINDSPKDINTENWSNDVETDGRDEAIIPTDVTISSSNIIVDDTINKWLRLFGKENVNILLIFDCCHSGTISDLKYTYNYVGVTDNGNNIPYKIKDIQLQELADSELDKEYRMKSNVITISGCRDNQVSYEDIIRFDKSNKSQGVLSSSLRYVINSDVNSINDVFKVIKGVMFYTKPYKQYPVVSSNRPLHTDSTYRAILSYTETDSNNSNNQNSSNVNIVPVVVPSSTSLNNAQKPTTIIIEPTTTVKPITTVKPTTTVKPIITHTKYIYRPILRPTYQFTASNMFRFLL